MINLKQLSECRKCGESCSPISPKIGNRISFIYNSPSQEDFNYGELFQNRGCYFAFKMIKEYFPDAHLTSVKKCLDGKESKCFSFWTKEEVKDTYKVFMGKEVAKRFGVEYNYGEATSSYACFKSPNVFSTCGDKIINDFKKLLERVKNEIEKNSIAN